MAVDINNLLALLFGGMQQAGAYGTPMQMGMPAFGSVGGYMPTGQLYSPYGAAGMPYGSLMNIGQLLAAQQQQAAQGQQQGPAPYWQRVFNQYNAMSPAQQQGQDWGQWFGGGPQQNWGMLSPQQQQQVWNQYGPGSAGAQQQQDQYWKTVAGQYGAMSPLQRQQTNWQNWAGGQPYAQWQGMTPEKQQETWNTYFSNIL